MPRTDHDVKALDAALKEQGVPRRTRRALRRKALHKAIMTPRSVLDVLTYETKNEDPHA